MTVALDHTRVSGCKLWRCRLGAGRRVFEQCVRPREWHTGDMLTGVLLSQVPLTDYRLDYRQNITGHAVSGVGGNYPHSSNQECRMLHAGHTCRRWVGYELQTGAFT